MLSSMNKSKDDINDLFRNRKNFLDLHVFIEELSYTSVTQIPAYSEATLQSKFISYI